MTSMQIAFLLLALLTFFVMRKHLHIGWALLALFAGLYASQTKWVGPHLLAIGNAFFREVSRIKL